MRVPKELIEKAASTEPGSKYCNVYLDTGRELLIATDDYIGAEVSVEIGDGDISGPISLKAIEHARQGGGIIQARDTSLS